MGPAHEQDLLGAVVAGQVAPRVSSLRSPFTKWTRSTPWSLAAADGGREDLEIVINAPDSDLHAPMALEKSDHPAEYISLGIYKFKNARSIHSTSRVTCSSRTSPTLRGRFTVGLRSSGRLPHRGATFRFERHMPVGSGPQCPVRPEPTTTQGVGRPTASTRGLGRSPPLPATDVNVTTTPTRRTGAKPVHRKGHQTHAISSILVHRVHDNMQVDAQVSLRCTGSRRYPWTGRSASGHPGSVAKGRPLRLIGWTLLVPRLLSCLTVRGVEGAVAA